MTHFIGFGLMAAFICAGILYGGTLEAFIDPPSAMIVVGILAGGALASFSPSTINNAFADWFSSKPLSAERASESSTVFFRFSELSIAGGFIGTLIGLVLMLQNMEDPTAIGPAMAVALLTILYGFLLSELVFRSVAAQILERGNGGAAGSESPFRKNRIGMVVAPVFVLMTTFFIMMLAMASFI